MYKNRVINISLKGFAFEFDRCQVCTGYEVSTVHPLCLLAPNATRFDQAKVLDFILSISRDVVLEVKGKIAHIYQPVEWPKSEIVGVAFIEVAPWAEQILQQYIE
jgi:hypothetical protein